MTVKDSWLKTKSLRERISMYHIELEECDYMVNEEAAKQIAELIEEGEIELPPYGRLRVTWDEDYEKVMRVECMVYDMKDAWLEIYDREFAEIRKDESILEFATWVGK